MAESSGIWTALRWFFGNAFKSIFGLQFFAFIFFAFALLYDSIKESIATGSLAPFISELGKITFGVDMALKEKMIVFLETGDGIWALLFVLWIYLFVFRVIFRLWLWKNESEKFRAFLFAFGTLWIIQTFYVSVFLIKEFTPGFQGLLFFISHLPALLDPIANSWFANKENSAVSNVVGNVTTDRVDNLTTSYNPNLNTTSETLVQANQTIAQTKKYIISFFGRNWTF